jgi:alpha-tubulin suppressor-like RCC1 family protein
MRTKRRLGSAVLPGSLTALVGLAFVAGLARAQTFDIPEAHPGGVARLGAGQFTSFALLHDGRVALWGSNAYGEMGDGTKENRFVPFVHPTLSNIRDVAGGRTHMIAADGEGRAWVWGSNAGGQLGFPVEELTESLVPIVHPELSGVVAVAAGTDHSLALLEDGTVLAWGANHFGQLGDGTTTDRPRPLPVTIPDPVPVTAIATAYFTNFAILADGRVYGWGWNRFGMVGIGTTDESIVDPTPVLGEKGVGVLEGVRELVTGDVHTLVRLRDETLLAWGRDNKGQLGRGVPGGRPYPVRTYRGRFDTASGGALREVAFLRVGCVHSLAVERDGDFWYWGWNEFGQLGIPLEPFQLINRPTRHSLSGKTRVIDVAAGLGHTLLLDEKGRVWGMGYNSRGQLGNGLGPSWYNPVPTRVIGF